MLNADIPQARIPNLASRSQVMKTITLQAGGLEGSSLGNLTR